MMRIQILILALLCYGIDATAQQAHLSREAYRDRVENYSQILKQQQLKSVASMEGRKIAFTGFLPQVDITRRRHLESERNGCMGRSGRTIP